MIKYLVAGILAVSIFACGKKEEAAKTMETGTQEMQRHEGHRHGTEGAEKVKEEAEGLIMRTARADEVGKAAVCPVMGTKFKVQANTEAADYKGKSYFFCCGGCPGEFGKNPDKYAK